MVYLVDTNVLVRFASRGDPLRRTVLRAVRKLRVGGHAMRAAVQNLVEFWNVVTRPIPRNGLGLTPAVAHRRLRRIERVFRLLPAAPAVFGEWRRLVVAYGVSGAQVHDAHLTAVMVHHGIMRILTFNTADFTRYAPEGIVAVNPATV